jgi:hypothetical protein
MRPLALFVSALLLSGAAGCGQTVDFKQALQIVDVSGGWYDFGIVDGKNKLVPSLSFRVRKAPDVPLSSIALNVHFKWVSGSDEKEPGEVFLQRVEFTEGNQTPLLKVRPDYGYTADAPQTRAEMLGHSQFRDAHAIVFGKQSSTTWVELLRYDIPRVLITK